jgi:hypothetical protein
LSIHARKFEGFPPWRRGYARFLPDTLKEFAKRFVTDVEAIVGEALPDLLPRRSLRPGLLQFPKGYHKLERIWNVEFLSK